MAASLTFKAVGKSLDDLAKRCREMPRDSKGAIAFASSGMIQVAGAVIREKYVVPGEYSVGTKRGRLNYTSPPGATHGSMGYTTLRTDGKKKRDIVRATENKIFVKGKFVSRTGQLQSWADGLRSSQPSAEFPRVIDEAESIRHKSSGELVAGVDSEGRAYIEAKGGYRAAEVGQKGTISNGVRGLWRGFRASTGRFGTIIKKRYPELLRLNGRPS